MRARSRSTADVRSHLLLFLVVLLFTWPIGHAHAVQHNKLHAQGQHTLSSSSTSTSTSTTSTSTSSSNSASSAPVRPATVEDVQADENFPWRVQGVLPEIPGDFEDVHPPVPANLVPHPDTLASLLELSSEVGEQEEFLFGGKTGGFTASNSLTKAAGSTLTERPDKCSFRCNLRGKCLPDTKGPLDFKGSIPTFKYKCECKEGWTGKFCEMADDLYVKYLRSKGKTERPKCCKVCPTQLAAPLDYLSMPMYINPYSVPDPECEVGAFSEYSRPGLKIGRDCRKPLNQQPAAEQTKPSAIGGMQNLFAFLEIDSVAKRRQLRFKHLLQLGIGHQPEDVIDVGVTKNSPPMSLLQMGTEFLFGGGAPAPAPKKDEKKAEPGDCCIFCSFYKNPKSSELFFPRANDQETQRQQRLRLREELKEKRQGGGVDNVGHGKKANCCVVCPMTNQDRQAVFDKPVPPQITALLQLSSKITSRAKATRWTTPCCGYCESQFFLNHQQSGFANQGPFGGPDKPMAFVTDQYDEWGNLRINMNDSPFR